MIRLITLLVLTLTGTLATANTFEFNPANTIRIQGPIDGSKLWTLNEFERMSRSGKGTIDVLINSPGGHIVVGNLIINAMEQAKQRGVKVRCVSTVIAASMAFQLLMHCDERYAMRYTKLLFHPPRIFFMGTLLERQMRTWVRELDRIERKLIPGIRAVVKMSDGEFNRHYQLETLWDAEDLITATDTGWLHLISDVRGIIQQHSMAARGARNYSNGTQIYESQKAIKYWVQYGNSNAK